MSRKIIAFLGIISMICAVGFSYSTVSMGREAQVVATIQIGPEWEPLGRGEPLVVPVQILIVFITKLKQYRF